MKTETLISQILPAQKKSERPERKDLQRPDAALARSAKVDFADLLKPQAAGKSEQNVPTQRSTASKPEPREAKRSTTPSNTERIEQPQRTTRQAPEPEVDNDQNREEALRQFEQRKQSRAATIKTKSSPTETNQTSEETQAGQENQTAETNASQQGENTKPVASKGKKIDPETGRAIQKVIGDDQQLAREIPALAILTGKLELVEPKSIPVVVSSNAFLQEAFSATEVNDFLATPISIGQILTKVGVDQADIKALADNGVDVAAFVSPAELFDNLGFDVNRLGTEIKILKDNISLKNGLATYIARAEKLQSSRPVNIKAQAGRSIESEFDDTVPQQNAQQQELLGKARAFQNGNTGTPMPVTSTPVRRAAEGSDDLQAMIGAETATLATDMERPVVTTESTERSLEGEQEFSPIVPQAKIVTGATQPSAANPNMTMPFANAVAMQPTPVTEAPITPVKMSIDDLVETVQSLEKGERSGELNIETLKQPAFAGFAKGTAMFKVDVGAAPVTPETLVADEPVITREAAVNLDQIQGLKTTAPLQMVGEKTNIVASQMGEIEAESSLDFEYNNDYESNLSSNLEGQPGNKIENKVAQGIIAANIQKNPAAKESIRQNTLERMAITSLAEGVRSTSSRGNSEGQNFSGQQQDGGAQTAADMLSGLTNHKNVQQAKEPEANSFEKMLKLDAPNHLTSKVIDRARMMVKEGGGEVILDLGTEELGKLELAMNITNNKVDLKIIAASDQVRELLSQDIGTLRESLAIQDLNLSEVEVGVSGREHSRESFQQAGDNTGRDSGQQFASGRHGDSAVQGQIKRPMIRRPVHLGRIQVQA